MLAVYVEDMSLAEKTGCINYILESMQRGPKHVDSSLI